jgi:hypothetical protein
MLPTIVCAWGICLGTPDPVAIVDDKLILLPASEPSPIETGRRTRVTRTRRPGPIYLLRLQEDDCGFTHICSYWLVTVPAEEYDRATIGARYDPP